MQTHARTRTVHMVRYFPALAMTSLMIFVTSVANSCKTGFLSGCHRSRNSLICMCKLEKERKNAHQSHELYVLIGYYSCLNATAAAIPWPVCGECIHFIHMHLSLSCVWTYTFYMYTLCLPRCYRFGHSLICVCVVCVCVCVCVCLCAYAHKFVWFLRNYNSCLDANALALPQFVCVVCMSVCACVCVHVCARVCTGTYAYICADLLNFIHVCSVETSVCVIFRKWIS